MGRGDTSTLYARAELNDRGQITIPVRIRNRLGLKTRDRVEIMIEEGGNKAELVALPKHSIMDVVGRLKSNRPYASMDEIRHEAGIELAKKFGLRPEAPKR